MADFRAIADALKAGNAPKVKEMVEAALAEGISPEDILNKGLIVGMSEVGELFKNNEIYVPEVLIAARAMYAGLNILKPLLAERDVKPMGKVVIGTVKGDLHDIGKNLVAMMLEGAGFEVTDLGIDVSPEKFVNAAKTAGPGCIVAMSALLTTTMPAMKDTIEALKAAGIRDQVKVMVGGAPVTQKFADEIGADGYAPDAASAADLAKTFVA
ncbi:5-methyltetrahydrofolate--homocysteine methyltransferase [Caldicoprobacter guelmensis]|uniref:corrinoid protein n=1 Tax=Caldicoprobacter guelmensis TaxID=1170224 RepID=UPI00195BD033|nr:corrinoid protein [Caldicoprobacter guelmensis]MBM7582350.1 5-methyltetrahydrofolate--homocysteine methyltransferase [Caldicoprobacter guelmensis]